MPAWRPGGSGTSTTTVAPDGLAWWLDPPDDRRTPWYEPRALQQLIGRLGERGAVEILAAEAGLTVAEIEAEVRRLLPVGRPGSRRGGRTAAGVERATLGAE